MTARLSRVGLVVLGGLVAGAVVGCGGAHAPAVSNRASHTATAAAVGATTPVPGADVTYQLPGSLCAAVDDTALKEILPVDGGTPILDGPGICATSRSAEQVVVSLSYDAELVKSTEWGQRYLQTARRLTGAASTEVPGVGSGAFWAGDQQMVKLVSYHGNLVLTFTGQTTNSRQQLPAGFPERLGRVAAATFARLGT